MKKTVLFFLTSLIFFLSFSAVVSADVSFSVSKSLTGVRPGHAVYFDVVLTGSDEISGGSILIDYSDDWAWVDSSKGWVLADMETSSYNISQKQGSFQLSRSHSIAGTVFEFALRLPENAVVNDIKYVSVTLSFQMVNRFVDRKIKFTLPSSFPYGNAKVASDKYSATFTNGIKVICHDHTFGDWTRTADPTCIQDGEDERICTVCGEKEVRSVSARGHVYTEWMLTKEATCEERGEETRHCIYGDDEQVKLLPPHGHDYGEAVVIRAATEEEEGISVRQCSRCEKTEEMILPRIVIASSDLETDDPESEDKANTAADQKANTPSEEKQDINSTISEKDASFPLLPVALGSGATVLVIICIIVMVIVFKKKKEKQ